MQMRSVSFSKEASRLLESEGLTAWLSPYIVKKMGYSIPFENQTKRDHFSRITPNFLKFEDDELILPPLPPNIALLGDIKNACKTLGVIVFPPSMEWAEEFLRSEFTFDPSSTNERVRVWLDKRSHE